MPLADVVEIYLPAHRDFGWVRARTWWGSIVTFKLPSEDLEGWWITFEPSQRTGRPSTRR